ncbi:hypothetical protein RRG08_065978 [Elysia crispata]|uniref:Uncharacterized protein n=1 Tax=Elysia crispata TaxID=231223 RepID=A0AAE1DSL9_9GAST|nr:hypothetical protein RRG08_065978 [Elysia crispata]
MIRSNLTAGVSIGRRSSLCNPWPHARVGMVSRRHGSDNPAGCTVRQCWNCLDNHDSDSHLNLSNITISDVSHTSVYGI